MSVTTFIGGSIIHEQCDSNCSAYTQSKKTLIVSSFVTIHPFFDGNGRMARLLANLPVLHSGLPPIVVPSEDRLRYKRCLSDYQNTIDNLPELQDMSNLPENDLKHQFIGLCQSYWAESIALLDNANTMQLNLNATPLNLSLRC